MMGRGRTRKVEKGVSGGNPSGGLSSGYGSLNVPSGPVFYPSEEEFKDPLEYIYKIRPEAEPYGICKIVPPASWKPPFALDMDSFTFPTKSQAIHQLQARSAPCDSKTFRLEYNRFLEEHCGKKGKKRIVFEGEDLDLCKLFNAVKRFGGYDNVVKGKKWGEVFRFIRPEYISAIPAGFKLLRVLDVMPIKFSKLPSDMYQLLHLRYIALSLYSTVLPAAFSKLWNLQTVIVDTTSRTLQIKVDILNMIQLRHFKTNASATLPKTDKSSKGGERIQTLGTISPESCTEEVFGSARNLKKLGIRGRLALLLEDKNGSFDSLIKLHQLENLKLINDLILCPPSEHQLRGLPPAYKFPTQLRSLTLCETSLDWSHMSILGSLDKLEVLKLKDKAFWGKSWVATDGGFRHLEVLHIGHTNLENWVASHHHFPRLKCLELRNCENLKEIPIGLADIPNFRVLDLHRSKRAATSAKKIHGAKRKQEDQQSANLRRFKLSIFPPEE